MLQTRINAGFTKYFCLFKLNYNYCNTRNTRKSLQKTKVLLPDVLFRQAIAPLSYFILFLQIGVSHQRFIYRLRSFSAFADCPYYQGLTSVHISCCEDFVYRGLILIWLCIYVGSSVDGYLKCVCYIFLTAKESGCDENYIYRDDFFSTFYRYHHHSSGLWIFFAL